jgi:hypothetical protein
VTEHDEPRELRPEHSDQAPAHPRR